MVLHPIDSQSYEASAEAGQTRASVVPRQSSNTRDTGGRAIPAWEAVERKQKQEANAWWLVAQSDHAALSGDLAANLSSPFFPKLDVEVVHAISLHDAGWAQFDGGDEHVNGPRPDKIFWAPKISAQGKPLSFLEMRPAEFVRAWSNSIACAEKACAIGGIVVSVHFSRLAESRLRAGGDTPDDTRSIRAFVSSQAERRSARANGRSAEEIDLLVDVLQFFDLLSLYLCCGAQEHVQFPQTFNGRTIRLLREGEMLRTEPALFGAGVSLGVRARLYTVSADEMNVTTIPFLLA